MKLTHLQRREAQAPIVSSLISAFADKIGYDKAIDIAKKVIREDAILSGKTLAEEYSGNSIAELSKMVKAVWAKDDALEIKMNPIHLLILDFSDCHQSWYPHAILA